MDPHGPESTNNLKAIPLNQVLNLSNNISTFPIQYINEVLLKVLFQKIQPNQKFSFVEEIKTVSFSGPTKLNNFKKIHFKKLMISRLQTISKVKRIREAFEELKFKTHQLDTKDTEGKVKFEMTKENLKRYAFVVAYVKDMICMTILREILDMKILLDIHCTQVELMDKSDMKFLALKWFSGARLNFPDTSRSDKTSDSSKNLDPKFTALNKFVKILENHNQDQVNNCDNRSHNSDFSLKFNKLRRLSSEFFDY